MLLRKGLLLAFLSIALGVPAARAQDGIPILNSAGRYLGVGWSRHGYQAAGNGQFRIVRARHPQQNYPSRHLSYPYSPGYQPIRPSYAGAGQQPAPMLAPEQVRPQAETKDPGPPPEWLQRYLQQKENGGAESIRPEPEPLEPPGRIPDNDATMLLEKETEDRSPSDLGNLRDLGREDQLVSPNKLNPEPSLDQRIESTLAPSPSEMKEDLLIDDAEDDLLLQEDNMDDLLLEADDEDDLLLEEDDEDDLLLDEITSRSTDGKRSLFRQISTRTIYLRK
ncbi:MAG: hypothetical protein AAF483_16525 [Planctomycetota bacterium]